MKMHGDVTAVDGDNKGNHPSLVVFRCSRSSSLAACPSPAQRHRAEPRVEPAAFPSPAQPYGQVSIFRHGSSGGGLLLCTGVQLAGVHILRLESFGCSVPE